MEKLILLLVSSALFFGCGETTFSGSSVLKKEKNQGDSGQSIDSKQAGTDKDANAEGSGDGAPGAEELSSENLNGEDLASGEGVPGLDQLKKNPACLSIIDNAAAEDLKGESLFRNGSFDSINVKNVNDVLVNGNVGMLTIDGANEVRTVNGNIGPTCIRTPLARVINGNFTANADTENSYFAIIGQKINGELAKAASINGNSDMQIVLIDVDVEIINGGFKEIHIYGGTIKSINGTGDTIHLYNDAKLLFANLNGVEIIEH